MLDRVCLEVIRNALRLAAEEMGTAVVRASFSSIIQEMAEASACVLTANGRLVHGPQPIHSSSLRLGLPANVTDFYGEGLLLPPVKLYDAGEPCTPVVRIPAGTWRGEFHIDDGSDSGKEYVVRVALSARNGRLALDFDGTSPQADGIINAAVSQVYAAIVGALRACLSAEFPIDEGAYRCLDVTLPEGTLVNPRKPAACNGRVVTANATFEAIVQALAQATPELAMAASGIVHIFTLGGIDATGTQWGYLSVEMGGAGARARSTPTTGAPSATAMRCAAPP